MDPLATITKIAVVGTDTTQAKAVIAFNAAMVAAVLAAQVPGQATTPPPTSQPGNITTDPIQIIFDGTYYTLVSALNYIKYVPAS